MDAILNRSFKVAAIPVLWLALIRSLTYNSRRLETIGYALSVLFLQQLIAGAEDVFLICPQFPVYISPRDAEPDPDVTLPDSRAKGVYVDVTLLLVRGSQTKGNLKLSEAFRRAYNLRNHDLHHFLDITVLEVPLLEEKKRAPTRHPRDLEAHVNSIWNALAAAQSQVVTQAKILFSSPRFAAQDLVVLVASSGEYYRLAVLSRGHEALSTLPPRDDIEDLKVDDVTGDLSSELVVLSGTPTEREQQRLAAKHKAEKEATEKQTRARKARATPRSKRKDGLCNVQGLTRTLSQIVIDAGDPPYSDDWIERCHEVNWKIKESSQIRLFQRYPEFF